MAPERDVDAQPVSLEHELLPTARPNAEQHLELVVVAPQAALRDEPAALPEQPLVVRRDADVAAGVQERLERADIRCTHGLVVRIRDLGRLDVNAFAEANARLQIGRASCSE